MTPSISTVQSLNERYLTSMCESMARDLAEANASIAKLQRTLSFYKTSSAMTGTLSPPKLMRESERLSLRDMPAIFAYDSADVFEDISEIDVQEIEIAGEPFVIDPISNVVYELSDRWYARIGIWNESERAYL